MSTPQNNNRQLFILAFGLTLFFALLEIIYGFISGSLMVIGDGIHMSSDAFSLGLSLVATLLATKVATTTYTFGYKRFEPIAAFINGLTLIIIPIIIIVEAVRRLVDPVTILPKEMLIIGTIGLVINAIVGFVLSKAESNLNVRSAMLHVLADMFTSFSAVVAAVLILLFGWTWADPIGSVLTSCIIIAGGVRITKEAFRILMEGVPHNLSVQKVQTIVQDVLGETVEEVKLWCMNEHEPYVILFVTNHLLLPEKKKVLVRQIEEQLHIPSKQIIIQQNENAS